MTKANVLKDFKSVYSDFIIENKHDTVALNEAFFSYADSLCKHGDITQRQYETWSNPF